MQELLDHYPAVSEPIVDEHVAERLLGFVEGLGYDYPLAGSQPVVLQYRGQRVRTDILHGGGVVGKRPVRSRRNAVLGHEPFGEVLARLDAGCGLSRSKYTQIFSFEAIRNSPVERRFGSDNRKAYLVSFGEVGQRLRVGIGNGYALGLGGYAGIARCAIYLLDLGRLGQRVDYGVAASSGTNDKYFHLKSGFNV